jgi:hypothetical protein
VPANSAGASRSVAGAICWVDVVESRVVIRDRVREGVAILGGGR